MTSVYGSVGRQAKAVYSVAFYYNIQSNERTRTTKTPSHMHTHKATREHDQRHPTCTHTRPWRMTFWPALYLRMPLGMRPGWVCTVRDGSTQPAPRVGHISAERMYGCTPRRPHAPRSIFVRRALTFMRRLTAHTHARHSAARPHASLDCTQPCAPLSFTPS